MATIIQMPGPRERRLLKLRYGVRTLGDATADAAGIVPWYSNPFVVMGALLFGGMYLGGLGHREAQAAGRRHRRRVRQAKSMFHQVDWGTVGAILAATAISGTVTYVLTKKTDTGV